MAIASTGKPSQKAVLKPIDIDLTGDDTDDDQQVQCAMQASLLELHGLANSGLRYSKDQQPAESHKIKQHHSHFTNATTPSAVMDNTMAYQPDGARAEHTPISDQSTITQQPQHSSAHSNSTAAAAQLREADQMSLPAKSSEWCGSKHFCESSHVHTQPTLAEAHEQSARRTDGSVPANCLDATVLAAALGFQLKAGCLDLSSTPTPGASLPAQTPNPQQQVLCSTPTGLLAKPIRQTLTTDSPSATPVAPVSIPSNKRQKLSPCNREQNSTTSTKTLSSPPQSPGSRQLSIRSFLHKGKAAISSTPTKGLSDATTVAYDSAQGSPNQPHSTDTADARTTPSAGLSQFTPEAQQHSSSAGNATPTCMPQSHMHADGAITQKLHPSANAATPTCHATAEASRSGQDSNRDGSAKVSVEEEVTHQASREADSVRADCDKGKGYLGPCPLHQPILEPPCQIDRTKPGSTVWWCCESSAWVSVTVKQCIKDAAGLLTSYVVTVQQEACEVFDMELPRSQVCIHLSPGARVRIKQDPPAAGEVLPIEDWPFCGHYRIRLDNSQEHCLSHADLALLQNQANSSTCHIHDLLPSGQQSFPVAAASATHEQQQPASGCGTDHLLTTAGSTDRQHQQQVHQSLPACNSLASLASQIALSKSPVPITPAAAPQVTQPDSGSPEKGSPSANPEETDAGKTAQRALLTKRSIAQRKAKGCISASASVMPEAACTRSVRQRLVKDSPQQGDQGHVTAVAAAEVDPVAAAKQSSLGKEACVTPAAHRGREDSDEDLFVDLSGCNIKSRHSNALAADLMAVFAAKTVEWKPKLRLSPEQPNKPLLAVRSPSSVSKKSKAKDVKSSRKFATHDADDQQDGDIVVVLE